MNRPRATDSCRYIGIDLKGTCPFEDCWTCGWNPEVNAVRRKMIAEYESANTLHLWGKSPLASEEELESARKALERGIPYGG